MSDSSAPQGFTFVEFFRNNPVMMTLLVGVCAFVNGFFFAPFNLVVLLALALVGLHFSQHKVMRFLPYLCVLITGLALIFTPEAATTVPDETSEVAEQALVQLDLIKQTIIDFNLGNMMLSMVLVTILAQVLNRYRSWSLVVETCGLLSILAIVIVRMLVPELDLMVEGLVTFMASAQPVFNDPQSELSVAQVVESLSPLFLGLSVLVINLEVLFCLWLVSTFKVEKPIKYLQALRLSKVMVVIFAGACAGVL